MNRISVAPMMDWTDRHCRYLLRLLSRHVLLYTEMVTTDAILRGDRARLLEFSPAEHPVALQLGGADPRSLAECARIGADLGYDEINLNVGCPSDRVQSGRFGACLMREPDLVVCCVAAMARAVQVPVTVKSRIGVDEQEEWPTLLSFAAAMQDAGAQGLIVHARKAWLQGLSPKENREIPPLRHELVHRLKAALPSLPIAINGGIRSHREIADHLARVDGVMLGRAAYRTPCLLSPVDGLYYQDARPPATGHEVVHRMMGYIEREMGRGTPLRSITRHMLGLFQGTPGARAWRRCLSENTGRNDAGVAIVAAALRYVADEIPAAAE